MYLSGAIVGFFGWSGFIPLLVYHVGRVGNAGARHGWRLLLYKFLPSVPLKSHSCDQQKQESPHSRPGTWSLWMNCDTSGYSTRGNTSALPDHALETRENPPLGCKGMISQNEIKNMWRVTPKWEWPSGTSVIFLFVFSSLRRCQIYIFHNVLKIKLGK